MGVNFYVCYASMISMGLKEDELLSDIRVIQMPEFLELTIETDSQYVIG
jgi:predicted peroxiredoxin